MIGEQFEKIYKETYNDILKFIVMKCYNLTDVNDIIQDTYIELYKKMKKKKKIENMYPFICGIAINVMKRYYCKKHVTTSIPKKDLQIDMVDTIPDHLNLEEDFINQENVEKVWNFINTKDIDTIKIFYLYFKLDEKIVDIAIELNLSESNVKNKLYRTLKEMKTIFGKEEEKYE